MSLKMRILPALAACLLLNSCWKSPPDPDESDDPKEILGYMVQGPWNIGDPVHEILTLMSIRTAIEEHKSSDGLLAGISTENLPKWDSTSAHTMTAGSADESLHQFLRGVIWPDDPEGLFFKDRKDVDNFSTGIMWQAAFKKDPADPKNITARSHFGDLQYLHSMSPEMSMATSEVRRKMLQWAGFLVDVAGGGIKPGESLSEIAAVAGLFPNRSTVSDLLTADPSAPQMHVRHRALGALLHMVQDSYAHGHASRSSDGEIVSFHCYNDPDHDHNTHALQDRWGAGATLKDRIANTPGAEAAIDGGSGLLALINAGKPKSEIMKFLEEKVFNLAAR